MRFWPKDSERKPDPAPLKTDDRTPILIGLVAWAVALVLALVFAAPIATAGMPWLVWSCVAGLGLGLAGLAYTALRRP